MDETHRRAVEETAPGPQETIPRVLSLSECAERLRMKPSNVAKYLERHGVRPVLRKAQGYFWPEAEIERLRVEREADVEAREADERRRQAALTGQSTREPRKPRVRLGKTQRELMETMIGRPVVVDSDDPDRFALLRLRKRGLVEKLGEADSNGRTPFALTAAGHEAVADR